MRLTDKTVKNTKPKDKRYRIFDGEGLYVEVDPNGSKYWRMKYRFGGKENVLSFGVYPKVTLADARRQRQEAKEVLSLGRNPKYTSKENSITFEAIAMKWFATNDWSPDYEKTVLTRLQKDVFPRLGSMEINKIDAQDVLGVIKAIENRGASVKAKRVLRYINSIFTYAIVTIGEMKYSPAINLNIAIKSKPVKNNPFLRENQLPEFLKRLDEYSGSAIVRDALEFTMLTMARTKEVRLARVDEIDGDIWKIPADRMKMKREHWVPLPKQAMAIIERTNSDGYLFPGIFRKAKPMSENTLLYAIYDMGYRGKLTTHGLRATASTILNERGYDSHIIEKLLSHTDSNKVRAAYNHAEFLNERRAVLQRWADLLDDLRNS